MSRKGRVLLWTDDCVDASIHRLEDCLNMNEERLIIADSNHFDNIRKNYTTKTGNQKWDEKPLYWYFKWQTGKIAHKKMWTQLLKGNLKGETESLLMEVQNNAKGATYIKAKIDEMQ